MNLKNSAIMLSFAAAMALLNTTAFAIDMSRSEVIKTTGKVSVKKTTSPDFKKLNSNLKLAGSLKNLDGGDKVRTFNDSTADLALKDTCILMVKEQSIFEVPQVLTQNDLKVLKAQQGSVLFKVAKGNNFQVHTADVICGVKGTMFSVTVVDGLETMLETPGLQIGFPTAGGTAIDVYEGEVEVTNRLTNAKQSLKNGEGTFLEKGAKTFSKIYKFASANELSKIWGKDSSKFLNYDTLHTVEWYGSSDNYNLRKVGSNPDLNKHLIKNHKTNYISRYGGNVADFANEEEYKANYSRFSRLNSEKTFYENSFSEAFLGGSTFVAGKASNGATSLTTEPGKSGVVVTNGYGLLKIDSFSESLSKNQDKEILANVYEEGSNIITVVRNSKNNLYWREPGSLDIQQVPAGDVAYTYNQNTCKGTWSKAASGKIPDELTNYNFTSLDSMYKEKQQVQQRNTEKKVNAVTDSASKIADDKIKDSKTRDAVKKGVNKLGGFLKKRKW